MIAESSHHDPDGLEVAEESASMERRRVSRLARRIGAWRPGRGFWVIAWVAAALGTTGASVLFRSQIAAAVQLAPYDDGLFLRLADAVGEGAWLGSYDHLTLAKGPAYPVFVAVVGFLQMPLKLSEHAVYLVAAAVMALVVYRLTRNGALALILYAALALNPTMWSIGLARIIRDGFYAALSLGAVASCAWVLLAPVPTRGGITGRGTAVALLAAAVLGVYWLTREEGVWLGPALAVLVVASWSLRLAPARSSGGIATDTERHVLAFVGLRLVIVAVGAAVVLGGAAATNALHYGVALTNDLTEGSFPAAYGALARIEDESTDRYVPVPAAARADAYRVSPAAAELEPFLDGESGAQWTSISCGGPPDPEKGCVDIRGGWFMWALREAVQLAGHWGSAPAAQAFLGRLAAEINAACDADRLRCGAHRASLTPPIDLGTLADAAAHLNRGLTLMTAGHHELRTGASLGTPAEILRVALKVGPVAPLAEVDPPQVRIVGWLAGMDGVPSITQAHPAGSGGVETVTYGPAPDVDEFFEDSGEEGFSSRRFQLVTDCVGPGCRLLVSGADGEELSLPTATLAPGPIVQTPSLWMFVELVEPVRSPMDDLLDAATLSAHPRILATMEWFRGMYAVLLPIAATAGVAGIGLALLRREPRGRSAALMFLAIVCALAVAARLMIIALIEVTSWPGALNDLYLAPGSAFLVTFAVLGCYLGVTAVTDIVRQWVQEGRIRRSAAR